MRNKPFYSLEMRQECVALYETGLSCLEVADLKGPTHATVAIWVKAAGKSRPQGGNNHFHDKRKKARELLAEGKSISEVAVAVEVTTKTVYQWIKTFNRSKAKATTPVLVTQKVAHQQPVLPGSTIRPLTRYELMVGKAGGYGTPIVRAA